MDFLDMPQLFVILFSLGLGSLSVFVREALAVETAVHVYLGCVNVIPTTKGAKPMALCAEKGPRIVDGDSAIIQAGFVDHMDDWKEDYPRLEQLIIWPPNLKDVYIGGDLCVYPQQYRITYDAPNAIFKQCITHYYDRALGKVSNPYYVWYHNQDKNLKAETLDDFDPVLTAERGDYQEYTATPLEQQLTPFSVNDGDQLLGSGDDEGDLFTLTDTSSQTEHEIGYENEPQDVALLPSNSASAGADDDNFFAIQPASAGNDLDQLFTMNSADEEAFSDPFIFLS